MFKFVGLTLLISACILAQPLTESEELEEPVDPCDSSRCYIIFDGVLKEVEKILSVLHQIPTGKLLRLFKTILEYFHEFQAPYSYHLDTIDANLHRGCTQQKLNILLTNFKKEISYEEDNISFFNETSLALLKISDFIEKFDVRVESLDSLLHNKHKIISEYISTIRYLMYENQERAVKSLAILEDLQDALKSKNSAHNFSLLKPKIMSYKSVTDMLQEYGKMYNPEQK